MYQQFKTFLTSTNALALAVGVIIGAATGKVVTAVVEDLLMPIISLILPSGNWRESQLVLKRTVDAAGKEAVTAISYGHLFGVLVDFLIISYVVFFITKLLLPKKAEAPKPATRVCPACLETIPADAKRCKYCTSDVAVAAVA